MDVQVNASQAGLPAGMEAVLGFLQQGTHELPVTLQAKVNGLARSYNLKKNTATSSTAPPGLFNATHPAPSFYLVLNDANNQPILQSDATITVSSANGFLKLGNAATDIIDGTGVAKDDGVLLVKLSVDTLPASIAVGDDLLDEIIVTVDSGGEIATLTRPITLRVVT